MAYGKVNICGTDTSKLPVLSAEEMIQLMKQIKDGDENARCKFINANLRLVLSVVQRFSHRGEMPDDLFQVGCIGLIKAVKNFDVAHEVRFSTYAVPMIIGEIRRYLRDNNCIRVSRSVRDLAYKAMQAREELSYKLGRDPSVEEIAGFMQIEPRAIENAFDAVTDPISIYDPVFRDGNDAVFVVDQIKDENDTSEKWTENLALNQALSKLGSREKRIINMRYYLGKTQTEVAAEIGISQAQVSRLEKSALENLRKQM